MFETKANLGTPLAVVGNQWQHVEAHETHQAQTDVRLSTAAVCASLDVPAAVVDVNQTDKCWNKQPAAEHMQYILNTTTRRNKPLNSPPWFKPKSI